MKQSKIRKEILKILEGVPHTMSGQAIAKEFDRRNPKVPDDDSSFNAFVCALRYLEDSGMIRNHVGHNPQFEPTYFEEIYDITDLGTNYLENNTIKAYLKENKQMSTFFAVFITFLAAQLLTMTYTALVALFTSFLPTLFKKIL